MISAGFHELIEPVLEREGVRLEVLANRVDVTPDGWVVDSGTRRRARPAANRASARALRRAPYIYVGTAIPTAARRSPPTVSSPATPSRAISTGSGSPTSRSATCTTSSSPWRSAPGLAEACFAQRAPRPREPLAIPPFERMEGGAASGRVHEPAAAEIDPRVIDLGGFDFGPPAPGRSGRRAGGSRPCGSAAPAAPRRTSRR